MVKYFLLILVFFPSITFGAISAEIFPWAMIFSFFALSRVRARDALITLGLIVMLTISAMWSILNYRDSDAIRSLAAYVNPIAIFIAFLSMHTLWLERAIGLIKFLLPALILMGLAQYTGLLRPIEDVLQFFVPRSSGGALAEFGNRGVTLFSTEPSRAGVELVLLYHAWRFFRPSTPKNLFFDAALLAYLAFVIGAAQPMAFAVIVIGLMLVRRPSQIILIAIAALFVPYIEFSSEDSRVLVLASTLASVNSISELMFLMFDAAGPRLISIYAFYMSGVSHPFGLGVGSWATSSFEALRATGIDLRNISYFQALGSGNAISIRGSGVLTNLMLDVGIVGTSLFLYWVFAVTRRFRLHDRHTLVIMSILLIKIAFIGSIGEPMPWVVSAILLRLNHSRHREASSHRVRQVIS